jgi:hypothetical protein
MFLVLLGTQLVQHSAFKLKSIWHLMMPLIRHLIRRRLSVIAAAIENYLNSPDRNSY